jgi:hypothetical protein
MQISNPDLVLLDTLSMGCSLPVVPNMAAFFNQNFQNKEHNPPTPKVLKIAVLLIPNLIISEASPHSTNLSLPPTSFPQPKIKNSRGSTWRMKRNKDL